MVGKRHASEEISAKLAQAKELAAEGKTQREISKALGISIMTYHRWRDDRDFTEQEQRLQEVLAHLHSATNSVRKGAELLADLIKARG
ncbi:transcriptional regulator with XRE-family HTH domain [Bradyrhizobium sp. RT9b]|uniref:phBC6A51 family helix-turn-helix protein n=1 Tax=unclassified Bradyrhizobium TaxID=2631580 RepID=UPI0033912C67